MRKPGVKPPIRLKSIKSNPGAKSGAIKLTPRRTQVWNAFTRLDHLTVKKLFLFLKKRDPTIGLTTVYRTMGDFRRAGLVKTRRHQAETYFDKSEPKRQLELLICNVCGRTDRVVVCNMDVLQRLAARYGYLLDGYKLEIIGSCTACWRSQP